MGAEAAALDERLVHPGGVVHRRVLLGDYSEFLLRPGGLQPGVLVGPFPRSSFRIRNGLSAHVPHVCGPRHEGHKGLCWLRLRAYRAAAPDGTPAGTCARSWIEPHALRHGLNTAMHHLAMPTE